jgi:tRNA A-37 threonylcarbamoyl transferase component Bud32
MSEPAGWSLGQYRVLEQIGQGGMAGVYKAYQNSLDRFVAIKMIPAQFDDARDNDFLARFAAEARLVARLTHPNIVPVHDFGEASGWAFIVMEYIEGGTLRDLLVEAEETGRRPDLGRTLELLYQAALALDFAHGHGIIHRDVKPGNMLLRTEDQLLLTDFGIATMLEANKAFSRSGANVGTPQYMAPEQGLPDMAVDGRADIYALGVVMFQCVVGRLPFASETAVAIMLRHIHEPVPRPSALVPGVPPAVEHIILRALAKDPAARYQRAREMAAHLANAIAEIRGMGARARTASLRLPEEGLPPKPVGTLAWPQFSPRGLPGVPGTCLRCGTANDPRHGYCTSCGYELSGRRGSSDHVLLPDGRPLRCQLVLRGGPRAGQAFTLHQDITTLGRIAGNDVILPDPTVSRRHARLYFHESRWYLEDLNSANGTFVNDVPIVRPAPLLEGDEVRLGDLVLEFQLAA